MRDSTGLYNLMDLITAVDAFFSTGTTEKLKAYMKQTGETDPDILNLLDRIDHATDSAVKFQKDTGLLPLSTSAIEQTLGDVAFYLFKLKECKATAPVGIELLDSNKAF